jgi:ABC-2 type transport system permease protein
VNHPLVFLLTRSFWNGLLFRLRRLRQPKYLFGSLFGVAYLFLTFGRFYFLRPGRVPQQGVPQLPGSGLGPQVGALILLAAVLIFSWVMPGSRAALLFTEPEIAWLLPAPLRRATLIRYKLLKAQLGLVFTSLLFTFLNGRAFQGTAVWPKILGWWLILFTLQLHRLGASFALQRLRERGLADAKRRAAFAAGVLVVAAVVYFAGRDALRAVSLNDLVEQAPRVLNSPAARWVLSPFRLVVAPWFAATPGEFLAAVAPALAIIILHYVWVIRADVSFEEASIALSQRRAAFLAARQRGERSVRKPPKDGREAVFPLRPAGPLATAFFWKSLLQLGGRRNLRIGAAIIAAAFALSRLAGSFHPSPAVNGGILAIGAGILIFAVMGTPNQAAIHFRRSVETMDLLKSYPVRGWQIVAGELGAPLLCGLAVQWSIVAFLLFNVELFTHPLGVTFPGAAIPCVIAAAAILPGFNLVSAFLPCASTLLLPAWFKGGKPGMEASGMRILVVLGQLIAFTAALVPAAGLALVTWLLLSPILTVYHTFLAAALVLAAVLFLEGAVSMLVLGRLFDGFDVSEEAQ